MSESATCNVEWMSDGTPYDPETGEVFSPEQIAAMGIELPDLPFTIDADSKADWALEKLAKLDAEEVAIAARLKAVTANLVAELNVVVARRKWWHTRFAPDLQTYAAAKLEDAKAAGAKPSKTVKFTWGKVSWRTSKGTNRILPECMPVAVEWMEMADPTKVKVVKSVTVTDLIATVKAEGLKVLPPWIESTGPSEKCHINTGVGE